MESDFIVKWLLSLVIGSSWVVVSTTIAEKVGGRLGGLITGLPSTAVVGLLFIGLIQGIDAAREASIIVPLSAGMYVFFFITYLKLAKSNFWKALLISLFVWFTFAVVSSFFKGLSLTMSIFIWLVLVSSAIYWATKNVLIKKNKIPQNIASGPIWIKALISGGIISSVVLISKLAGPTWGGIFTTFPAITVSTMIVTVKSGGLEFTRLIAKNILISTTTTIAMFAILSYFTFPVIGVIVGTVVSYIILLIVSIPLYQLLFAKLKD